MTLLSLILSLLALVFLWPRRLHRPAVTIGAAALSLLVAASTWILVAQVAGRPQRATRVSDEPEPVRQVLAVSDDEVIVLGRRAILRVDLHGGRVRVRLPMGHFHDAFITGVAWNGHTLLFTFHEGVGRGGWAALAGNRWLVPPQLLERGNSRATPYWDRDRQRFVITWPASVGHNRLELRTLSVDQVGTDLTEQSLVIKDAPEVASVCPSGRFLYIVGTSGSACQIGALDRGVRPCIELHGIPAGGVFCPGQFVHVQGPGGWIGPHGIVTIRPPPDALLDLPGHVIEPPFVRLSPDGVHPVLTWAGKEGARVRALRGPFLRIEARLAGPASQRAATVLTLLRGSGAPLATARISGEPTPLVFRAGAHLVALSHDLTGTARFTIQGLDRIDPRPPIETVRDHFRASSSGSTWFEIALGLSLLLGLLLPAVVAARVLFRDHPARLWTLQRFALGYLVVALPTLIEALQRVWS